MLDTEMVESVSNKHDPSTIQTPAKRGLGSFCSDVTSLGGEQTLAKIADVRQPRKRDYA